MANYMCLVLEIQIANINNSKAIDNINSSPDGSASSTQGQKVQKFWLEYILLLSPPPSPGTYNLCRILKSIISCVYVITFFLLLYF